MAESLVENLTNGYSGFVNHPLILEGCKHEYIWTKTDPDMDPKILHDSVLKVCVGIHNNETNKNVTMRGITSTIFVPFLVTPVHVLFERSFHPMVAILLC
jgi:hypothetical protein